MPAASGKVSPAGVTSQELDDGIEILTGVPAGVRREDGTWPEDSINFRVEQRLVALGETLRKAATPPAPPAPAAAS